MCRQVIVLGSVKVSRQIEQVTCSLRFFNKDSIVRVSFHSDRTDRILVQRDSGKLGPYKALHNLHLNADSQAANQI